MYIPTHKQVATLQRLMEADGLIPSKKHVYATVPSTSGTPRTAPFKLVQPQNRVAILVDTPNASKSVKVYGEQARPDYAALTRLASGYGSVQTAIAFINPGYRTSCNWASRLGYRVVRGSDHDVDHLVVSTAVEVLAKGVSTLVLVSGDHRFCDVQSLCGRLNVRYVAVGVPSCTNLKLRKAGAFHALPVLQRHQTIAA